MMTLKGRSDTALIKAVIEQCSEQVQSLVECGVDIDATNKFGCTALMYAVETRCGKTVQYLIEHGANINQQDTTEGGTALIWAVCCHDMDIVKYLVEQGVDISIQDTFGYNALIWAAKEGCYDIVKYLIRVQDHSLETYLAHPDQKVRQCMEEMIHYE